MKGDRYTGLEATKYAKEFLNKIHKLEKEYGFVFYSDGSDLYLKYLPIGKAKQGKVGIGWNGDGGGLTVLKTKSEDMKKFKVRMNSFDVIRNRYVLERKGEFQDDHYRYAMGEYLGGIEGVLPSNRIITLRQNEKGQYLVFDDGKAYVVGKEMFDFIDDCVIPGVEFAVKNK